MITARNHIAKMASYALADLTQSEGKGVISLSQNESLRPPSPLAIEAACSSAKTSNLYPDPDWSELRQSLAELHNIQMEGILCGNGSLDLIGAIALVYSGPKTSVLAPAHAYPFFRTATQMAGARFDTASENGVVVDIGSLLDSVRSDTRLLFIANPGNPTGTRITKQDLVDLRSGLPDDVLLVIDEAYGEFADHLGERCFDLVEAGNTIVLRTFSKAYGMAGWRVGWGLFPPDVAREIKKVLNPNNVSASAQSCAVAAIEDHQYLQETCSMIMTLRDHASAKLVENGFSVFPSFTNFLLIDLIDPKFAQSANDALRKDGIFLRQQSSVGLPQMLRMTIGPKDQMDEAVEKLITWKNNA